MRYIVVNPDGPWVQGDLHAADPVAAACATEERLSSPPENDLWWVFEAPADFPPGREPYGNNHPAVMRMIGQDPRWEVVNGLRPEQGELFAPGP